MIFEYITTCRKPDLNLQQSILLIKPSYETIRNDCYHIWQYLTGDKKTVGKNGMDLLEIKFDLVTGPTLQMLTLPSLLKDILNK